MASISRMQEARDATLEEWRKVQRPGVGQFLDWLVTTDYFTAPCSTQYHLACAGGLALHSLNVLSLLRSKNDFYELNFPDKTLIVCGLGHDVAKVGFYSLEPRWRKDDRGKWVEKQVYVVKDTLPLGHGERSVIVLQNHMLLTPDEQLSIRWHMGGFDPGVHFNYPNGYPFQEACKIPLVTLLQTSDLEATRILELEN